MKRKLIIINLLAFGLNLFTFFLHHNSFNAFLAGVNLGIGFAGLVVWAKVKRKIDEN